MSGLPEYLYHGTSAKYLDNMLRDGLHPCSETGRVHMTCLTDDIACARHHADCMASFEDCDAIIFKIPTARLDPDLFVLEDRYVDLWPTSKRGRYAKDIVGLLAWALAPWTWRAMLIIAGGVGYTGIIPVATDDICFRCAIEPCGDAA